MTTSPSYESTLIKTLFDLVASKEAVFFLCGWPAHRVPAMYCFLKTTQRRSTGRDTLLPS